MIITAVEHIRALLAGPTEEQRNEAAEFCRTGSPRWEDDQEILVAVHPDDGKEYEVAIQDCNGSLTVHIWKPDDGPITAKLDDGGGDWEDTQLIAIFEECELDQCVFFVSDEFEFRWGWRNEAAA